jgi:DNA-binding transcriptional LysR family regulator
MRPALSEFARHFERLHALAHTELNWRAAPVRLGVLSTIGPVRIAAFLAEVERRMPAIEVTVEEDALDRLWTRLGDSDLDACIVNKTPETPPRLSACTLYVEHYVVVLPPGHPLTSKSDVTLADLAEHRYVDRLNCEMKQAVASTLEEQSLALYAKFRSAREDWVQSMVLAGVGYAVMPEYSVTHPELLTRPLAKPGLVREVALLYRSNAAVHQELERFVETARDFKWAN